MSSKTKKILKLKLSELTQKEIDFLHKLKALAIKKWIRRSNAKLKNKMKGAN